MHSKRLGVGVTVVNRLLYAIGGFNGKERLATVECYHPENNVWNILPAMKTGRSGAGVVALNQYIYVVGGFDGTRQLASVERYDTELQVWDTVASIKIARSALSVTTLDNKLYAMGGYDGQNFLNIVEVYNPVTNIWEEGVPLTSGRSGHASAVIYQPSCVNTFMDCLEQISDKKNDRRDGHKPFDNNTSKDTSQSPPPSSSTSSSFSTTSAAGNSDSMSCRPSSSKSNCVNLLNNMYHNNFNGDHPIRPMAANILCNNNSNRSVIDKNNSIVFGDYVDSIINNESLNDIKLNSIISNLINVNDNSGNVNSEHISNNNNSNVTTAKKKRDCILTRKFQSCRAKRLRKKSQRNADDNSNVYNCKQMKRKASDSDALCLRQVDDGGEKVKSHSECPFTRLKQHLNDFVSSIVSPASSNNNNHLIDDHNHNNNILVADNVDSGDVIMLNSNDLLAAKNDTRKTKCKLKSHI